MTTLGDILKSFGAAENLWKPKEATSAHDETTAAAVWTEALNELKALLVGVSNEEAEPVKQALVSAVSSKVPDHVRIRDLYESLTDVLSAKGDTDGAARARDMGLHLAELAREALLSDCRDPRDLCCVGRALLERCEANELPLCEDNFLGSTFDFGSGDQLRIDYFCFVDPAVEAFSDEPETVNLAIQAFGLAWLYYRERSAKKSDAWRALQALDGLRAAFLHAKNVEALQAISEEFWDWVEDWHLPGGSSSDDYVANFRSLDAYVQGRLHRDPANRRAMGKKLANKLTDTWERLPQLPREYLINAEILFEHLDKKGDWASAVNEYSKAIEALLRERLGRQLDGGVRTTLAGLLRSAIDQARGRETRQYSRIALSTFSQALMQVAFRSNQPALRQVSKDLDTLVRIRGRAAHADTPWKVSREECEQVRDICLADQNRGLVRQLSHLDLNR